MMHDGGFQPTRSESHDGTTLVAEVVSPPASSATLEESLVGDHWLLWPFRFLKLSFDWLFGLLCIVVGVGYLATIPVIQLISLGYLLEVSGRIAVTGRLRNGFIHVLLAGRIGGLILGTWLTLLIPNLISDLRYTAALIDPASGVTRGWGIAQVIVDCLAGIHIVSAWSCGGRIRHFFWPLWLLPLAVVATLRWLSRLTIGKILVDAPRWRYLTGSYSLPQLEQWLPPVRVFRQIRSGQFYARSRDAVWNLLVVELQPLHFFWIGLQGLLGTLIWLAIPVGLMMAGTSVESELGTLCGWIGGLALTIVVLYLPFLQVRFAAERRFGAFFEVGRVREQFRRAPVAFLFALFCTLLFAVPLYLLKIELTPSEVTWLPSLPFVAFMLPAKMLTGWAVARAGRRDQDRFFLVRWFARTLALPLTGIYVIIVFFSQYVTWYGVRGLLEQHAFLVPSPFTG